jgi:glycosyltransferase involved in cell wall biosynthesis
MLTRWRTRPRSAVAGLPTADVCIVVEGCYPFVSGGVSSWIDWLIRTQPDLTFHVVALSASADPRPLRYQLPDNVVGFATLALDGGTSPDDGARPSRAAGLADLLADDLVDLVEGGGLSALTRIGERLDAPAARLTRGELLDSRLSLAIIERMYERLTPQASFLQFFWAWRSLFGGLFAVLDFSLPPASVYHTISTGYAGVLAARAAAELGRPVILTEHGIYTNERRIEILMADWISDTVDKGIGISDVRLDIRDFWIRAFEAYARVCYDASAAVTTLYSDNQRLQIASGALPERMRVIANGIDVSRFVSLPVAAETARPTIALIGRVVPIKDVKTFIRAAGHVRKAVPDLRALIMGPTDEDPGYFAECQALVAELGLARCVEFTGAVRIVDHLPSIHVVVLTSLSEAQPLVLLEAGAAGIPCVATDVGACREILEGARDETQTAGRGGIVTELVAPEQTGDAIAGLLADAGERRRQGETLRRRVCQLYNSELSRDRYAALYREVAPELLRRGAA